MKLLGGGILSGLLLALSLPPYNVEWLGWFALAPLFVVVRGRRPLEAMGLAMLPGIVTAWAEAERRRMTPLLWTFFVASAGVGIEWLTTFTPLPLNLALCQHRNLPVIQIADLTGIWGVSFLVWGTNAAVARLCLVLTSGGRTNRPCLADSIARLILLAGIIAVSVFFYGWTQMARFGLNSDAVWLRVAAIQDYTGIETADLAEPTSLATETVDREAMTRQAARRGAQFIVGSEGCCESNGLSQIVNTCGRIVKEGPLYAPAVLVAHVALGSAPRTVFTRWGDWFAYLCLLLSLVIGARQLLFSSSRAILGQPEKSSSSSAVAEA